MKLSDLKKGYANLNAGVWVDQIPSPLFEGIELQVRRLWSQEYRDLHDKLTSEAGESADEEQITTACLVEACLVNWKGIDEPYTVALAHDLIADPEAGPAFRNALLWAASNATDRVKAQLEADEKN